MSVLDDYRAIDVTLDTASDWIPPVRLNAGDVSGRSIRVRVTDGGVPVTDTDVTARLLWNRDLNSSSGGYVTMSPVTGTDTLTFSTPIPRQALTSPSVTFGVELSRAGSVTDSRNFEALVEPSVLQATGEIPDDLAELKTALDRIATATDQANTATGQTNTATANANTAADAANTAATNANTARDSAATAASNADTAAADARTATGNADQATTNANTAADAARSAADAANAAATGKTATTTTPGTVRPGNGLAIRTDGTLDVTMPVYYTTGTLDSFTSPSTPCIITGPQIGVAYDDGKETAQ